MADREEKQKYLRENIQQDEYQDFADFCQNEAGQIDIDKWSFDFVQKLVGKYRVNKKSQQENGQHQRSFANYQTADINQAYSLVTQIQKAQQKKVQEKPPQRSATDLLDSVFQNTSTDSISPNNSPPQNLEIESKFKTNSKISAFQNGNIWATTSNVQQSARKSNQFDNFWQFTSTNNNQKQEQFKTDTFQKQGAQTTRANNALNVPQEKQKKSKSNETIPTFDQLTRNINMSKKSSPHIQQAQKPSNMKKQNNHQTQPPKARQHKFDQVKETNSIEKIHKTGAFTQHQTHQIKLISQKPLNESKTGTKVSKAAAYKMNKIPYQGPTVHKSSFTDTVKCYKAMTRPHLSDENLSVSIDKHQIVQRNFFVSDYVMYYLTVKPIGLVCKRNYEDFTKLRAALQKVYPGLQLPYLQKNSWFQTSIENIKKQKSMLEFFLNDLIKNPQIRNSRIFEDFLTLKEHKAMKRKFQDYAKMDKFKGLQELCLLDGQVKVVVNQNQRIYHQQLGKILDSFDDLLQKKRKLTQTLAQQFTAIHETLSMLAKLSTALSGQVKKFNQRVSDDEIPGLQNTFNIVAKSYDQWASRINFESRVVNKRLAPFYKYQKDNISTLRQILDTQNSLLKNYLKRNTYQPSTTHESYTSQKLAPLKNGIVQESKNTTIAKYHLGYMSNMLCKETARFFELMSDNFKAKWVYKAQKYTERLNKDLQFYGSVSVMAH